MKKILIMFAKDWDQLSLRAQYHAKHYQFFYEGFDLFQFPQNARLLSFNVLRYIQQLEKKYRKIGLDGIISNHEQFGALIAAVLAERLGLPGNSPLAIIACQHKYYCRMVEEKLVPQATPRYAPIAYPFEKDRPIDLAYPFFVKPIKATYSVLAKQINSPSELADHLRFGFFEEWIIRRLVKPFADLMPLYTPLAVEPNGLLAEEIMVGQQMNIDGFCQHGQIFFLGVIDEIMYPGTQAFMRFEYPSRLPESVQQRAKVITQNILEALHYQHGFFNIEFIYDAQTDQLKIIEINPRLASQLANLYERVDGYSPYAILFQLAVGEEPKLERGKGHFQSAASFIFRKFHAPEYQKLPSAAQLEEVLQQYPDANMMWYFKKGAGLQRELKWLGSYRYAVLNMGGLNRQDLFMRFQAISNKLGLHDPAQALVD